MPLKKLRAALSALNYFLTFSIHLSLFFFLPTKISREKLQSWARFLKGRLALIPDENFVPFVFYTPMHCLG